MDLNARAFRIMREATSETQLTVNPRKVAGRKGGLRGGPSRAAAIGADERREIARKASAARWNKQRQN